MVIAERRIISKRLDVIYLTNYRKFYKPKNNFQPVSYWQKEQDKRKKVSTPYNSYHKCSTSKICNSPAL